MTQKKIAGLLVASAALAMLSGATAAFAQTDASTAVPASVPGVAANAPAPAPLTAKMKAAIALGDKEITRRIAALTDLNTRVQQMTKVTDAFKQNLQNNIQTEITGFTALQAKVDADTDAATLKTDVQSITDSYRVFALILPQARIAAAADRIVTITNMISGVGAKLQARIQADGAAGGDVTALNAALADMGTKLGDAQTQAQNAVSGSASLTPDNGDKTIMASNTAALKAAQTSVAAAQKDLQAARKDIDTITNGLKKMPATASTTAPTTSTQ
jgi:hypothetical protein